MTAANEQVAIIDAWSTPEAGVFFRNVWPMYVHELSGFDSDFYELDDTGRWTPALADDWVSATTPAENLRTAREERDSAQPFQRTHVITRAGRPVGFVCVAKQPFKYMPEDVDLHIAELFLIHGSRGRGTSIQALELLLERYSGRWNLQVIHDNTRALQFWRKALPALGVLSLEERREGGDIVFRFSSSGRST